MYGNEVTVEDAGIFHTHTMDAQQVMRLGIEQRGIELVMCLDMFLGEDGAACCNPADERQSHLLTQGVLELNTPRGTGYEFQCALPLQRPQMFLGGIGRLETEFTRDLGALINSWIISRICDCLGVSSRI
jgi:hypothetical protein